MSADPADRYRVVPGGDLRFAGGLAAVDGSFSWSGPLTDREIDQLFALVADHGWESRDPPSRGEPADRRYRITLRGPGLHRRFEVIGDAPGVQAVEMILDGAARRRFDPYLERLPQPGEQPG